MDELIEALQCYASGANNLHGTHSLDLGGRPGVSSAERQETNGFAAEFAGIVANAGLAAFLPQRELQCPHCIVLVTTLPGLEYCSRALAESMVIGVDVERHWLRSYRGYTCLLQLSTAAHGGRVFVVDCIKLPHKQIKDALLPVFENRTTLKIYHAAGNDLMWLREDFGLQSVPVLDIQVLTRLLGVPFVGLTEQWGVLCNAHASKHLKRRLQRSDWRRRPLAPLQIHYAAADSYFLLPIAGSLLRVCELLFPQTCKIGFTDFPSTPPARQNLHEDGSPIEHKWLPPSGIAIQCRPLPDVWIWWELGRASERVTEKIDQADDSPCPSASLRRAARRWAPNISSAYLLYLSEWRSKYAVELDESPQWLIPDELFARALGAGNDDEARAILNSSVPIDEIDTCEVDLNGDEEQVALDVHLKGDLLNEFARLLSLARAGEDLGSGFAEKLKQQQQLQQQQALSRWWLPFRSVEHFEVTLASLPAPQQSRVLEEPLKKRARFLSYVHRVAAKKPVYENCIILAPDGQQLCFVNAKKLAWYLKRNLADLVDDQTIQLRFEPRGRYGIASGIIRENLEGQEVTNPLVQQFKKRQGYYTSHKENRCVKCGSEQNLARYNIVPSCYRSFLPMNCQPDSHDVLLLCVPCHHRATLQHGQKIKEIFAARFDLLAPEKNGSRDAIRAARGAALGLLKGGDRVPWERAQKVFGRIREAWESSEPQHIEHNSSMDDPIDFSSYLQFVKDAESKAPQLLEALKGLHGISAIELLWRASSWAPVDVAGDDHRRKQNRWELRQGEEVVRKWAAEPQKWGELVGILNECRVHFVETMEPQFLPTHWDVVHSACIRSETK